MDDISGIIKVRSHHDDMMTFIEDLEIMLNRSYDEMTVFKIKLVLTELMVNACKHGNLGDEEKSIQITYDCTTTSFTLSVEDEGEWNGSASSSMDINDGLAESGRGLSLVQSIVQEIKFEQGSSKITIMMAI